MCKWERTEPVLYLPHLHKICNDPQPFTLQFESSTFLFFLLRQSCSISKLVPLFPEPVGNRLSIYCQNKLPLSVGFLRGISCSFASKKKQRRNESPLYLYLLAVRLLTARCRCGFFVSVTLLPLPGLRRRGTGFSVRRRNAFLFRRSSWRGATYPSTRILRRGIGSASLPCG